MSNCAILYIEDDPLSREVMETLLKYGMGYENVTIFEDSTDFMPKLEALPQKPDVIFMDIHMDPIDGFTMLQQIRQNDKFRSSRVIALTASVMSEEVRTLKTAGFNGGLAKPLDSTLFPQLLQRILNDEQIWHIK